MQDHNNLIVYVASHKPMDMTLPECYKVIEVGADLRNEHFAEIRDNEGENISCKNKSFCELTAYYWIWKQDNSDVVGLVHYRRYFSKKRIDYSSKRYLTENQILSLLSQYDVLLPEKIIWKKYSVAEGYNHGAGRKKDLLIVRQIIGEKYPQYESDWDAITNGNEASYCNAFIMGREKYSNYCSWLFDILFEAEKRIDMDGYSDAEKRVFGYLSEILINVWVRHNKLSVYYTPFVKIGQKWGKLNGLLRILDMIPGMERVVCYGKNYIWNRRQG